MSDKRSQAKKFLSARNGLTIRFLSKLWYNNHAIEFYY